MATNPRKQGKANKGKDQAMLKDKGHLERLKVVPHDDPQGDVKAQQRDQGIRGKDHLMRRQLVDNPRKRPNAVPYGTDDNLPVYDRNS